MSAERKAMFAERNRDRNRLRDFCLLLRLPYRALLFSAGVDFKAYWRGETTVAENDRVNVIAKACEADPERCTQIREAFYTNFPDAPPVYKRCAGSEIPA